MLFLFCKNVGIILAVNYVPRMCGIPVRDVFTEYDHEYELLLEDFKDTDGNVMEPVTICVHKKTRMACFAFRACAASAQQ